MIISLNQNPRTTKVLSNFLFGQAFVSAKNLLQQIITFCIKFISYFQIIPFGKRVISRLDAPGRQLQHPTNILCRYKMPCRTHYMSPQDFTFSQRFLYGLNRC